MGLAEKRLRSAGYVLPSPPAPAGVYKPALCHNGMVYTSGQLPLRDGGLMEPEGKGKVNELRLRDARSAVVQATLNALSAAASILSEGLDGVDRVVKLTVYVASEAYFSNQHLVANAASELLHAAFGENGMHVRSAVGVAELPMDSSVEVEILLAVKAH
ncbi:RidA family protein [Prosthecochloris vibrioformis]|uniref:RidA family protein n=1 Tax=Prosthecochloris vibrioformis TaxID=1098 RepID=A0A5C4S0S4_PROVB|nr:RidA family protein [Prosthecochloris vibrioformis]TNJ37070.1 RidA family protein [Prosthecochloris vibrioformis]